MIYILNYRGCSIISQSIKMMTWGDYSHTAIANDAGFAIESWHVGGVSFAESPWANHIAETPIVVYAIDAKPFVHEAIWNLAYNKIGKKYDFRALLGFIPGLRIFWRDKATQWFCSHLIAYACDHGGYPLFSEQTPLYKISPTMIDTSVALRRLGECINIEGFRELVATTTKQSAPVSHLY